MSGTGGFTNTETMRIDIKRSRGRDQFVKMPSKTDTQPMSGSSTVDPAERLFLELLESVYDAVLITTADGRVIKTNGRAKDFFHFTRLEFLRCNILDLISGASPDLLPSTAEYLQSQRHVLIEAYCVRRDGSFFPAEITVNTIHIGLTQHLCFFIRNITVRKETEEALAKAQSDLVTAAHSAGMAEIATGVLHDVGNILNSVNVSSEMILKQLSAGTVNAFEKVDAMMAEQTDVADFLSNDPKGQKVPQLISGLVKRLGKEWEELRDETRGLSDKIEMIKNVIHTQQSYAKAGLHMEPCSLPRLLEDALSIQAATLSKHAIHVERLFAPVPVVQAQRTKLIHILTNLIRNALDAMRDNGERQRELTLAIGHDDKDVYIRIKDSGSGISEENLTKIFTHGFTTKQDGHGFGLHSCANFMTEMGGRIAVASDGPEQGSAFTLYLPISRDTLGEE
jgi:PAS domain S-box-containing protein